MMITESEKQIIINFGKKYKVSSIILFGSSMTEEIRKDERLKYNAREFPYYNEHSEYHIKGWGCGWWQEYQHYACPAINLFASGVRRGDYEFTTDAMVKWYVKQRARGLF